MSWNLKITLVGIFIAILWVILQLFVTNERSYVTVMADDTILKAHSHIKTSSPEITILITEQGFSPIEVTIQPGETVAWVNQTKVPQQVTQLDLSKTIYLPLLRQDTTSVIQKVLEPSQPILISDPQEEEIPPNGSFTYTFTESGVSYFKLGDSSQNIGSITVSPSVIPISETYFDHPIVTASGHYGVDNVIIPEHHLGQIDKGEFRVRIGALGQVSDQAPVSWNVGQYTGFYPASGKNVLHYQRGLNNQVDSTAVQARNNEVGIWLNSEATPPSGTLLPITPAIWWDQTTGYFYPWQTPEQILSYSFFLKVPTAERAGQAQVYVTAYYLFEDQVSNKSFWYGAQIFDLRPASPETILFDEGTQLPIILSTMGEGTQWLHQTSASSTFQQNTWDDYKFFEFHITPDEFRDALTTIRNQYPHLGLSDTLSDYRLNHFNFNPEVYTPELSASSFDHIYLRGANTSSDSNMQIFFKTETSDFYSEDKSIWVTFPVGGGYNEVIADMSLNPNWQGHITGIRIDPFNANGDFGIDYIYIGDAHQNMIAEWNFDNVDPNQPDGWILSGIGASWASGGLWGGTGINNDPFFHINTNFQGNSPDYGKLGLAVKDIKISVHQLPVYDKIYLYGANASSNSNMQIFFKTETSDFYSEDKSVWVTFPVGGGYNEIIADMSLNPNWQGYITGIRIDPFNTNGNFGIDAIHIGDEMRNMAISWHFDHANPYQPDGWILSGIGASWASGGLWGGSGTNNDPFFHINTRVYSGEG